MDLQTLLMLTDVLVLGVGINLHRYVVKTEVRLKAIELKLGIN